MTTSRTLPIAALAVGLTCVASTASFEVASIKLLTTQPQSVGISISGTRVTVSAMTVANLVGYAYGVEPYQIAEGHRGSNRGWLNNERWDIAARAGGDASLSKVQVRLMLQNLLAERFQLEFHREKQEMPAYALVRGKSAPRLTENNDPTATYRMLLTSPRQVVTRSITKGTIEQLANMLANEMGTPVLDRTELKGTYDYKLEYSGQLSAGPEAADSDSRTPSIATAVQQQLGLKLESTKAPIEILVIDRAEQPTAN